MPIRLTQYLFAAAVSCLSSSASNRFAVTVSRTGTEPRAAETIVIPFAVVASHLPSAEIDHLRVISRANQGERPIPCQVTNFEPEEHRDHYLDLVFQHDFSAGETRAEFWIEETPHPEPPIPSRVSARYVPERFDDFAWENDRIGHRAYGPALDSPVAGKNQMASSGIDVWCKRVRYPIVDRWYLKSHYHTDTGEGLDLYDVGESRGAGGTGVWDGKSLRCSRNWKTWRVLANGPIRAVFELTYGPWQPSSGIEVREVKRFTVDAGHNLDQIDDTYLFTGAEEILIGAGLAKHAKAQAEYAADPDGERLTQWEKFPKDGSIGEAILLAPEVSRAGLAETSTDHLILFRVKSGQPVRYLAGAGWDQSGDFPDRGAWVRYVEDFSRRAKDPLRLTYSP